MIDELDIVRSVGAHEHHADPAAHGRVRARVFDDGGAARTRERPRRARRITRIVLAAATVAFIAGLVVVVGLRPSEDRQPTGAGAASPAAVEAPSLFPAPDAFLYVRSKGAYLSCAEDGPQPGCKLQPARVREVWLSEKGDSVLQEGSRTDALGHQNLYLGNRRFTHDELAAYAPTGPQLLRELQDGRQAGQGNGGASYPFVELTDALREAAMPPAVRQAIIDAYPLVPGVKELGAVTDAEGRRGLGFERTRQLHARAGDRRPRLAGAAR